MCLHVARIPYRRSVTSLGEGLHAPFVTLLSRQARQIEIFAALGPPQDGDVVLTTTADGVFARE